MNDLLRTSIFRLLSETSQEVTNEEMQKAYGEFVEQITNVSNGNDYSTVFRILVATRIEIASFETTPLYGQGDKFFHFTNRANYTENCILFSFEFHP